MNKKILSVSSLIVSLLVAPTFILAASPDGSGPWADQVVSSNQGTMKNGQPVPANRSNPQAAVGEAEGDTTDEHFFSLGFGGSIVLKFDNGVRDGIIVVEATNQGYPQEKANVEVSQDGSTWTSAGTVVQDGQVSMPDVACVNYVKITDQSNTNDFSDDTADAYDVDGVKAINAEPCDGGNTGGETTPSPTPTQTQDPAPTPTPTSSSSNSSNTSNSSSTSSSQCTATKPGTPSINSVERTSGSTVKLTWSAVSPATTYSISYGTSKGNYQFGVPSTGNVTSFVIGGLDPNATYYFQVRAVNDCMPGDGSGDGSTGGQVLGTSTSIGGGEVLGATTDVLGATGSLQNSIAVAMSVLAAAISYIILKRANS